MAAVAVCAGSCGVCWSLCRGESWGTDIGGWGKLSGGDAVGGRRKIWYDSVYVLPRPDGEWLTGFKLPRPLAYGVSISTRDGIICAGGADAKRHYADVFRLSWRNGSIRTESLPPLPQAMANGCCALMGETFYVAGGIENPEATNCFKTFWALDLSARQPHWKELTSWPGPARML